MVLVSEHLLLHHEMAKQHVLMKDSKADNSNYMACDIRVEHYIHIDQDSIQQKKADLAHPHVNCPLVYSQIYLSK